MNYLMKQKLTRLRLLLSAHLWSHMGADSGRLLVRETV